MKPNFETGIWTIWIDNLDGELAMNKNHMAKDKIDVVEMEVFNRALNHIASVEDKAVSVILKLNARIKDLENKISILKCSPATINEELQTAFNKEQAKVESLKQKLENCKAGRP